MSNFIKALDAMYALSENPDVLCGSILKKVSAEIFLQNDILSNENENELSENINIEEHDETITIEVLDRSKNIKSKLAKLCFLIGHIAMKQIVHLEVIDSEWKRRKSTGIFLFILRKNYW